MFAVKGWNVDANALKPQTEVFKGKKASAKEAKAAAEENAEKQQTRKRKREEAEELKAKRVDAELGDQWERYIEGKEPKKAKRTKKESSKEDKNGAKEVTDGDKNGGPVEDAAGAEKKKKAKKRSRDRKKEKLNGSEKAGATTPGQAKASGTTAAAATAPPKPPALPAGAKLTPMQAAMRQKLISARFRHLNETLYTEPSAKALDLFDQNPEMFEDYHSGFRQQVTTWPSNPVDTFIATIRARGAIRLPSQKKAFQKKDGNIKHTDAAERVKAESEGRVAALPRTQGVSIIADLGCGDARLAQTLTDSGDVTKLNLKILSYDLHSPSPLVTKADISSLPADDGSTDIAIFCLALMGTNWISFIEEAYRILHWKGELWIAEIKSRFGRVGKSSKVVEHSVGGKRKLAALTKKKAKEAAEQEEVNEQETLAVVVDGADTAAPAGNQAETDVSSFVEVLRRRGFVLKSGESSIDLGNKMFVKMEFVKGAPATKGKNKTEDEKRVEKPRFKKAKFLDEEKKEEDQDVPTDDEAKTLKPCLYKIR